MGKATIVGNQGAGQYTVIKAYDGLDGELAKLVAKRAQLEAELPVLRAAEDAALAALAATTQQTDLLIADWVAGLAPPDEPITIQYSESARAYVESATRNLALPPAIINAVREVATQGQQYRKIVAHTRARQAEYLQVIQREAELDRLKDSANTPVTAWCADYSTEITGEVATLEVPGEVNPQIGGGLNIIPVNEATTAPWSAVYGQIQYGTTLSPAGFAWNLTMLMPWLKWMPLTRYGTVTGKDEDANTLNISLLPIISKAQTYLSHESSFNEPWDSLMTGVPVEYMSCGAKAFEVGDTALVVFEKVGDSYTPTVVGFADHPKECPWNWPEKIYVRLDSTGQSSSGTTVYPLYQDGWESTTTSSSSQDDYGRTILFTSIYSESAGEFLSGFGSRDIGVSNLSYFHRFHESDQVVFGGENVWGDAPGIFSLAARPASAGDAGSSPGTSFFIRLGIQYPYLMDSTYSITISNGLIASESSEGSVYYHSNDISPKISIANVTLKYDDEDDSLHITRSYAFNRVVFQKVATPMSVENFDDAWCLDSIENKDIGTPGAEWHYRMWAEMV